MHLHWGLLRLIQYYVIYLQLSGKVEEEEVTLSSSISATSHVIHNFQEHRLRVCFSLSESESTRTRARERERPYLLTEDQLVIKEEEDSLLATSIRLIDP